MFKNNGHHGFGRWFGSFHHYPRLDSDSSVCDHRFEGVWVDQAIGDPAPPRGSLHHCSPGVFPSQVGDHLSCQRDGDSGFVLHWPLRAAVSCQCSVPGGPLHDATPSFPGAGICQALKNTLELPWSSWQQDYIFSVHSSR